MASLLEDSTAVLRGAASPVLSPLAKEVPPTTGDCAALAVAGASPATDSGGNGQLSAASSGSEYSSWDDRRPARLAPVGCVLAWESPSLFNTASLAAVLTAAPVSTVQIFPSGTADDVHAVEEDYDSDEGASSSVGGLGTEDGAKDEAHPAGTVDGTKVGMESLSKSGRSVDKSSPKPESDAVDFEVDWPKRSALPLLQFLDETGSAPAVAIGSVTKITQCRPVPGSSLRLDKLLAAGRDTPSQVWKATVQPTGYTVVLKLLTDQAGPKYPPNTRIPREEYEDCMDFEKASLGRTKQHDISRDADAFEALSLMQGTRVPYSYGYYSFELHDGKKTQVLGHVMEYVPSINIPRLFHKVIKHNERLIDAFYTSLFRTFIEIHRYDVCHQDTGLRNMLLYPDSTFEYQIVLIDLTMASSITYSERVGDSWGYAEELAFQRCLEGELNAKPFWDWMKTEKGKLLWDEFHRGPRRFMKVPRPALQAADLQAQPKAQASDTSAPLHEVSLAETKPPLDPKIFERSSEQDSSLCLASDSKESPEDVKLETQTVTDVKADVELGPEVSDAGEGGRLGVIDAYIAEPKASKKRRMTEDEDLGSLARRTVRPRISNSSE